MHNSANLGFGLIAVGNSTNTVAVTVQSITTAAVTHTVTLSPAFANQRSNRNRVTHHFDCGFMRNSKIQRHIDVIHADGNQRLLRRHCIDSGTLTLVIPY